MGLTVCRDNRGTARKALDTVYEHHSASADGLMDEPTSSRQVDEEVGIIHVLNANAEVADARGRVVRRDGLGANGDDMGNAPVRKRPRRNRGVDPAK